MDRDDTMKLLQECGFGTLMDHPTMTENMMRFANLVAAAEREACAEFAEEEANNPALTLMEQYRAKFIADAIRARGKL